MRFRMLTMTPKKIAEICGGTYYGDRDLATKEITGVVTDNRQVTEGGMFVAIKGAKVDGNRFVPAAYESGALCCMSEDEPGEQKKAYIQVKDCLQAIKDMAAYYRTICTLPIVGITGSVGKTTTKEMLASVLSTHFNTLKTLGNFNNELGMPLTLLRLREEHEAAIVEMGISDFGEMSRMTAIARPDMCVITNIGCCHLEQLGDRDGVLKAKTEIFQGMKEGGTVFLNGDDDKLITVTQVHGKRPVFFGLNDNNDVHPLKITSKGLSGTDVTVQTSRGTLQITIPVPGRHMITNALAAVAVGQQMGLSDEEIVQGIAAFRPVDGHGSVFATEHFTIMDDCYNANPVSMQAGVRLLSEVPERKVAILGDMFELGAEEEKLHYETGRYVAGCGLDQIICIGTLAKQYLAGITDVDPSANVIWFATLEEAMAKLPDLLKEQDAILIKASHGMHFEKIVAYFKEM